MTHISSYRPKGDVKKVLVAALDENDKLIWSTMLDGGTCDIEVGEDEYDSVYAYGPSDAVLSYRVERPTITVRGKPYPE